MGMGQDRGTAGFPPAGRKATSSIYLVSPAANPNYGDELIASGWLRYLAATWPETEVWLDCPNPGLATQLFYGMHPHLHVTNTLWRACWEAPSTDPHTVMARVAHLVLNPGPSAYDLGFARLRNVASIHMLGGGYLNNLWPVNAGLVAGAAAIRSLTGAKLYATGLSMVPLLAGSSDDEGSARHALIDLLRSFDHVTVRDEPSALALGLPLGLDDAFLAVDQERRKGLARGGADLIVCLQNDLQSQAQTARVAENVRTLVQTAAAEGKTVQYVEAAPWSDKAAFDALQDLIGPQAFIPFFSVWRDGLPLRPDQTWLTTRFHLHFMAAAAGACGTAISVKEGYYDVKHSSLINLGTGWTYTAASSARFNGPVPEAAVASFASRMDSRINQKRQEAQSLYPKIPGGLSQHQPARDRGMPTSPMLSDVRGALDSQW